MHVQRYLLNVNVWASRLVLQSEACSVFKTHSNSAKIFLKMWKGFFALIAIAALGAGQDHPLVTLPNLGVIRGRTLMTKGNLGNDPKPFYNFRNIPFAESVSGEKRFSVRQSANKVY